MANERNGLPKWAGTFYASWSAIGILILLAGVGYALSLISGAIAPFILAFLLVFLLQGPVSALEKRGLSRAASVAACFLLVFLVLSMVVVFVFPVIGRELVAFANAIPSYLDLGKDLLGAAQDRYSALVIPPWVQDAADAVSSSVGRIFMSLGDSLARGVVSAGSGIATVVFDLFLGAVIAFWTIKDLPKIRQEMRTLAGEKYEDDLENLVGTVGKVVGGYLKGQTIASLVTGAIAGIGLAIVGVPYALVLGIITYVSNYVPYIGPFLAGFVAAAVGLFVGPLQAVLAIVIVVVAQQITDLFVTPRVMSEQVDLHPTLVIFSLLVGGTLFGIWGMIFSIPFAATAKGLFVYYWEQRTSRSLATEDGAFFKTPACADDDEECDETPAEPGAGDDAVKEQGSE